MPSGRYNADKFLGKGTYAKILQAIHETNNTVSTFKLIDMNTNSFQSVVRECIVHILLETSSEKEPLGPYVPRFYEVAYDPIHNLMILRSERIQDILYFRYKASTAEENDKIIPHTLAHIAHIFDFFYKKLKFNHRDCKPDNILYNYSPSTGQFQIKIIDFTFSCLSWNGIPINAGEWFSKSDTCYLPSRDLTQFIYWVYTNASIPMTPQLRSILADILTFPAENRMCQMFADCFAYGRYVRTWGESYKFLNTSRIINWKAYPEKLRDAMMRLLKIQDVKGVPTLTTITKAGIPGLEHCVPEKVLNPITRRCVLRDSVVGVQLLKLSKKYSTPSTQTLKLRRKYANPKMEKKSRKNRK